MNTIEISTDKRVTENMEVFNTLTTGSLIWWEQTSIYSREDNACRCEQDYPGIVTMINDEAFSFINFENFKETTISKQDLIKNSPFRHNHLMYELRYCRPEGLRSLYHYLQGKIHTSNCEIEQAEKKLQELKDDAAKHSNQVQEIFTKYGINEVVINITSSFISYQKS